MLHDDIDHNPVHGKYLLLDELLCTILYMQVQYKF